MKYYNYETMFISLATKLGDYLKNAGIYFEISKNGAYYHFEILTNTIGAAAINTFLDAHTIWNAGVQQ